MVGYRRASLVLLLVFSTGGKTPGLTPPSFWISAGRRIVLNARGLVFVYLVKLGLHLVEDFSVAL
jgi:hypothetical protein